MNGKTPIVAETVDRILNSPELRRIIYDSLEPSIENVLVVSAVIGELRAGIRLRRQEGL